MISQKINEKLDLIISYFEAKIFPEQLFCKTKTTLNENRKHTSPGWLQSNIRRYAAIFTRKCLASLGHVAKTNHYTWRTFYAQK